MKINFKIRRALLMTIRSDLARRHPYAFERVGFISAGLASTGGDLYILARSYQPVIDKDYLRDSSVGAMVGPEGIRKALQWAMSDRVAIFHIHTHGGLGHPEFSDIDLREQMKFVPNFFQVAPQFAHGAIVLSNNYAHGHIWFDNSNSYEVITDFIEIGNPLTAWSSV
jgi:hypothetical protein